MTITIDGDGDPAVVMSRATRELDWWIESFEISFDLSILEGGETLDDCLDRRVEQRLRLAIFRAECMTITRA